MKGRRKKEEGRSGATAPFVAGAAAPACPLPSSFFLLPSFRVRAWNRDADYPLFCEWWAAHGSLAPACARLPDCGLVVEAGGAPALAAWLYQDNSCGVGWLAWFVGKPRCRDAARALPVLLGAADEVMRSQGRHTLLALTGKRGLGRALARHGYSREHTETQYWRILQW